MAFYGEGWVSIHLDARRQDVNVPPEFADHRHLVLQYGEKMAIPIPDLEVGDDGIRATLSFSRTPHQTFVPWSAVYIVACTDGRGILYYEDVPEDVSLMSRSTEGTAGETGELVTGIEISDGDDASEGEGASSTDRAPASAEEAKKPTRSTGTTRERLLKSVPAGPVVEDESAEALDEAAARRRKRPQLKVVK